MTLYFKYWTLTTYCAVVLSAILWPTLPSLVWLLPCITLLLLLPLLPCLRWGIGISLGIIVFVIQGHLVRAKSHSVFKVGQDITINAEVDSFFKQISHGFEGVVLIRSINGQNIPWLLRPKVKLTLSTQLYPGYQVTAHGRVKPIIGRLNEVGFDKEAYWFSQGVIAEIRVDPKSSYRIRESSNLRTIWYQKVTGVVHKREYTPLILSLIFGDRSQLPKSLSDKLKWSGLTHLFVISGLHIGMAFFVGWWVGVGLTGLFGQPLSLPILLGGGCALGYAYLAGFSIPTLRALFMCGLMLVLVLVQSQVSLLLKWLLTLTLVVSVFPFSALSAAFWLSFTAVAIIFYLVEHRARNLRGPFATMIQLTGIVVLITPFTFIWFNGVSLSAIAYNLIWVPWFNLVIMPATFLCLFVAPFSAVAAEMGIGLVHYLLQPVLVSLHFARYSWTTLSIHWQPYLLLMFTFFVVWSYLNVRGKVVIALIGMLSIYDARSSIWTVEILDVGHGLAVVIRKDNQAVIYDTGVAWNNGSMAESVISPHLDFVGVRHLQGIIISHFDIDHSGGLSDLLARWQPFWVRSSQSSQLWSCRQGEHWTWNDIRFTALWPPQQVERPYNPHSCVVRMDFGVNSLSILLTGDINGIAEYLLARGDLRPVDIVLAPHHGSRTSSTSAFVQQVSADYVVASTAYRGRWNLPSPEVVARYQQAGSIWLDTGQNGLIRIEVSLDDYEIYGLRDREGDTWYRQMLRNGVE